MKHTWVKGKIYRLQCGPSVDYCTVQCVSIHTGSQFSTKLLFSLTSLFPPLYFVGVLCAHAWYHTRALLSYTHAIQNLLLYHFHLFVALCFFGGAGRGFDVFHNTYKIGIKIRKFYFQIRNKPF